MSMSVVLQRGDLLSALWRPVHVVHAALGASDGLPGVFAFQPLSSNHIAVSFWESLLWSQRIRANPKVGHLLQDGPGSRCPTTIHCQNPASASPNTESLALLCQSFWYTVPSVGLLFLAPGRTACQEQLPWCATRHISRIKRRRIACAIPCIYMNKTKTNKTLQLVGGRHTLSGALIKGATFSCRSTLKRSRGLTCRSSCRHITA